MNVPRRLRGCVQDLTASPGSRDGRFVPARAAAEELRAWCVVPSPAGLRAIPPYAAHCNGATAREPGSADPSSDVAAHGDCHRTASGMANARPCGVDDARSRAQRFPADEDPLLHPCGLRPTQNRASSRSAASKAVYRTRPQGLAADNFRMQVDSGTHDGPGAPTEDTRAIAGQPIAALPVDPLDARTRAPASAPSCPERVGRREARR